MTQEALKLALEALELCNGAETVEGVVIYTNKEITAIKEALREHAMREVQRLGQEIEQEPVADAYTFAEMRFVVCHNCGNKRCPKANDHRNACTNSNEVGQKGSSWEHVKPLAQPEQEPVKYSDYEPDGVHHNKPQQEPVALEAVYETIIQWDEGGGKRSRRELARRIVALYTTPPQRTWVGLTDDEIIDVLHPLVMADMSDEATDYEIARAIEAKLKKKNT